MPFFRSKKEKGGFFRGLNSAPSSDSPLRPYEMIDKFESLEEISEDIPELSKAFESGLDMKEEEEIQDFEGCESFGNDDSDEEIPDIGSYFSKKTNSSIPILTEDLQKRLEGKQIQKRSFKAPAFSRVTDQKQESDFEKGNRESKLLLVKNKIQQACCLGLKNSIETSEEARDAVANDIKQLASDYCSGRELSHTKYKNLNPGFVKDLSDPQNGIYNQSMLLICAGFIKEFGHHEHALEEYNFMGARAAFY